MSLEFFIKKPIVISLIDISISRLWYNYHCNEYTKLSFKTDNYWNDANRIINDHYVCWYVITTSHIYTYLYHFTHLKIINNWTRIFLISNSKLLSSTWKPKSYKCPSTFSWKDHPFFVHARIKPVMIYMFTWCIIYLYGLRVIVQLLVLPTVFINKILNVMNIWMIQIISYFRLLMIINETFFAFSFQRFYISIKQFNNCHQL